MAKIGPIKTTKSEVSQTINLKEIFGVDFTGKEALRKALGQAFIDRIISKAKSGKRFDGKPLKSPYSKEYAESLEFKAAGKSRGKVNMTLSGDMLGSIDILDEKANVLKIGIDDELEAPKAYNHQEGDTVPARPFFGLNNKDVEEIRSEFLEDVRAAFKERGQEKKEKINNLILKLLGETDGEG